MKLRRLITKRACVRLTLLLALLVGGAIVNIAVAWAVSLWSPISRAEVALYLELSNSKAMGNDFSVEAVQQQFQTNAPNDLPAQFLSAGIGVSHWTCDDTLDRVQDLEIDSALRELTLNGASPKKALVVHIRESRVGWPVRTMFGAKVMRWPASPATSQAPAIIDYEPKRALPVSKAIAPLGMRRQLPLGTIWPGFAINTAFYAAILLLLFAAPFALRRRLRVKRGLCVKCAYDLRSQARRPNAN